MMIDIDQIIRDVVYQLGPNVVSTFDKHWITGTEGSPRQRYGEIAAYVQTELVIGLRRTFGFDMYLYDVYDEFRPGTGMAPGFYWYVGPIGSTREQPDQLLPIISLALMKRSTKHQRSEVDPIVASITIWTCSGYIRTGVIGSNCLWYHLDRGTVVSHQEPNQVEQIQLEGSNVCVDSLPSVLCDTSMNCFDEFRTNRFLAALGEVCEVAPFYSASGGLTRLASGCAGTSGAVVLNRKTFCDTAGVAQVLAAGGFARGYKFTHSCKRPLIPQDPLLINDYTVLVCANNPDSLEQLASMVEAAYYGS